MQETDQGVVIRIKVIPGSSKSEIVGWENGVLKIRIAAQPEKGAANKELIRFLSKSLKTPQRDILILQGETSKQKKICLCGKKIDQLALERPSEVTDNQHRTQKKTK